jgi:nucleotide-binding universal stress UspA family protein
MLLWIAYKLLIGSDGGGEQQINSGSNFWAAIKMIVIADTVMGLDNVLAVAGAAHGNFILVVLGLLISIPIMIAGSQLILKYVQKYPVIVYIGAGVLAWTGAKMMTEEPLVKDYTDIFGNYIVLVYMAAVGSVLGAGFWANQTHARNRVAARVVDLAALPAEPVRVESNKLNGEHIMKKLLIPVDGTASAAQAVRHVVNRFLTEGNIEVHLLHVRAPFSQHIARFVSKRNRDNYHRELAARSLRDARELLETHGVPYASHIELGETAAVIERVARRLHIDLIVMGTVRKSTLTRLVQDSVTSKVIEKTSVPVEVVAGAPASAWERIGVPATVGTALAALVFAAAD